MDLRDYIRTVPDFPKPGIMFRDITTVLSNPTSFQMLVDSLVERYQGLTIDKVVGIESRGFIVGAPVALALQVGFVPVRKPGKLPADVVGIDYELEYGKDRLEIHTDAVKPGDKILLIDDLLATGGTASASTQLVRSMGGEVVEAAFIINLPDIGGRRRLEDLGVAVFALTEFEGD